MKTVKESVLAVLAGGPRTPKEIALKLYGGHERKYRTPKLKDCAPKLVCDDTSGDERVRHALWELKKSGAVVRLRKGLYALPQHASEGD